MCVLHLAVTVTLYHHYVCSETSIFTYNLILCLQCIFISGPDFCINQTNCSLGPHIKRGLSEGACYSHAPCYTVTVHHISPHCFIKCKIFGKKYIFEIKYEFLVHLQFLSESLLSAVIIALNWSSGKVAVVQ